MKSLYEMEHEPGSVVDINYELPGISDGPALEAEVSQLRGEAANMHQQLELERSLSRDIHMARARAIANSAALRLVFESEIDAPQRTATDITIDQSVAAAFSRRHSSGSLPVGQAATIAKSLRTDTHPDLGGDTELAKAVNEKLNNIHRDPVASILGALSVQTERPSFGPAALRLERYHLHMALSGAQSMFGSAEEALANTEAEIAASEWRVRVTAAVKTFERITGGDDCWNTFLQNVVREQNMSLVNLVNRLQPEILGAFERMQKGGPTVISEGSIEKVDQTLEKIWSVLGPSRLHMPYAPPYHLWLKELMPALQLLDPGQKPGQTYTVYQPPIKVYETPVSRLFDEYDPYEKDRYFYGKGRRREDTYNYKYDDYRY